MNLKKLLLPIALSIGALFSGNSKALAQASSYQFSQTNGTYVPVSSSGTIVANSTGTSTTFDTQGWTISLPFTFQFNGTGYSSIYVNSNGGATFGTTTSTVSSLISSTAGFDGALSVMNRDLWAQFVAAGSRASGSTTITGVSSFIGLDVGDTLVGTGIPTNTTVVSFNQTAGTIEMSAASTSAQTATAVRWGSGSVRTETVGSAPNRTFVIEWRQFGDYNTSVSNTAFDFQIRLEETSNIIRYVYGSYTSTATTSRTNQVGLRGASNADFINRTATLTVGFNNTTAGTTNSATVARDNASFPSSGLTFTWTPASCLAPSGVTVPTVTTTSATFNWTAPGSAPASGYQYEVRTSGAAGSGATGLAASGSTGAGVVTATASPLSPATTYSVYVRSNCGAAGYSNWSLAQAFTTQCLAFTAPYAEGFNSGTIPNCWTNDNSISSTSIYLLWMFSGAPGYGATNNGRTSGTFAWLDASSPYNAVVTLTSPVINLSSLTTPFVRFEWFKNNSSSSTSTVRPTYPNNNLKLEGYNGSSWVTLFDDTSNAEVWRTERITLPAAFNGVTNAQFRFSVDKTLSNYFYDDVLLDSFYVANAPTCLPPGTAGATAVTSSGATLNWTAATPAPTSGYQYEVRSSGAAGSGTTGLAASGSTAAGVITATVTGLAPTTTYTVYVRSNCGASGYSTWASGTSFTTPCVAITTLPWNDGIESVTTIGTNNFPACWQKINGTWRSSDAAFTSYNDPLNGSRYLTVSYSAVNDVIVTPGFQLTAGTSYDFSFYWAGDGYTGWEGSVGVNTSQNLTGATMLGSNFVNLTTTTPLGTYTKVTRTFVPTTTGVYYFGVMVNSNGNPWYLGFDDFAVNVTPSCVEPTGLTVSAITSNGAALSWTAPTPAPALGYRYEIRTSGAAGSGATGLAATGTTLAGVTSATVSTLNPQTTYSVYVRSRCSATDSSAWTMAQSFTTACAAFNAPFYESFNNGTMPTCWTNSNSVNSTSSYMLWQFSGAPGYGATNNGRTSGTYAWVDASSPSSDVVMLTSPIINMSSLTTPLVKFDWFKNNRSSATSTAPSGYPNNNLKLEGYNGSSWVTLFDDTSNATTWRTVNITLPAAFNGITNAQFRFSVNKSLSAYFYDDVLLDSFSVTSVPPCALPTGITATATSSTGATLSWTAATPAPANGYEYEVRSSGAAGSGATGRAATGTTAAGVTTATVGTLSPQTTYSVYVRSVCGTSNYSAWTAATTVTTPCAPVVVNLGNDTAICAGSSLSLNAGNAGASYLWSNGATTQSITVSAAGSYSVRVTNASGCIGRDTINVTVNALPVVNLGNDTAICAGSSLSLNAGNAGASYLWSNGATTQSITVSAAGSYSVRVTNASGCIGRDTVNVTVNALPVVSLGADTAICAGSSLTLSAGNAGASYLWSNGATTQSITVSAAGSYSVRVTNASGCIGRDTVNVTVNALPVVSLGADTAICAGSSLTLSAGNAGASYLWSNGATTQSITVSAAGSYSVRVTNASGCVGRDTVNVTTNALPVVNLGRDTVICAGGSVTLSAGNTGASYLWSNGATTQSITISAAGSYSVAVTNANGCMAMDTVNVGINPLPVAGTITVSGQAPTFTFSVAGSTGAAIRGWRFGDGAVDTAMSPTHTYTANGTYTVTYYVANGCGTDSTSTTVTVNSYGVNNVSVEGQIRLFPNPSHDYVMVENTAAAPMKTLRILSVSGALISEVTANGGAEQRINVSHLAAGTYLVRIELADGAIAIKRMQVKH